jgi:hypothetical protein
MVLGIGEGSVDLKLNGLNFSPGQKITGTSILSLPQPKQARGLRLEFYGEIRRRSGKRAHTERVCQITQMLSGEKLYRSGESFPFEITVPEVATISAPGILGTLVSMFTPRPVFYVHASLDVPNEFDINRRVQVSIAAKALNVNAALPATKEEAIRMAGQDIGRPTSQSS